MFLISIFFMTLLSTGTNAKELNIVYTNDLEGSVDTCGCSMDPGGGAVRRLNWYKKNKLSKDNTLYINGGNTLFTSMDYLDYETKYLKYGAEVLADSLSIMNIDAYTPGEQDFKMGLDLFLQTTEKLPILITNSGSDKFKKEINVKKGNHNVSIIGVLSPSFLKKELAKKLDIKGAVTAVKEHVKKLKNSSDLIVLIANVDQKELESIFKISGIDVILSAGINEELTNPMLSDNNSIVVRVLKGGDSIGLLKYDHKKGVKKMDAGHNNNLIAQSGELDLIMQSVESSTALENIKKEKKRIEDSIIRTDNGYAKYENRIDFLGRAYAKKNELSAKAKKYQALQISAAPVLK